MEKDDENYAVMCKHREQYMEKTLAEAKEQGVEVTPWEQEEMELCFEYAWCKGYVEAGHHRKLSELN